MFRVFLWFTMLNNRNAVRDSKSSISGTTTAVKLCTVICCAFHRCYWCLEFMKCSFGASAEIASAPRAALSAAFTACIVKFVSQLNQMFELKVDQLSSLSSVDRTSVALSDKMIFPGISKRKVICPEMSRDSFAHDILQGSIL